MVFWREAGYSYVAYANVAAKTLRSVLKGDAKVQALKREDSVLKLAHWKDGKQGESKFIVPPKE